VSKKSKRDRQRLNREARRQAEIQAQRRRKQFRTGRNVAIFAVPLVAVLLIIQLRSSGGSTITRTYKKPPAVTVDVNRQYTTTIDTSEGKIVVSLDPTTALQSVNNFVFLAKHKFYDGLTFHRIAKDFVIQGGDPKGNGSGGPGYKVQAEVPANGYQVGSVAWAKTGQEPAGTAGSQFFIVTGQGVDAINQQPYQYGTIGTVTQGIDVAQKISALAPASGDGKPTKKVTIKKVTISVSPAPVGTAPATPST